VCFTSVSDACFKCFICLHRILQVLHMDVLKVDRVLHMVQCDPLVAAPAAIAGRHHGSPCECLKTADVSAARILRRGEASTLLSVMALRVYGLASVMRTRWPRLCYVGTGQGAIDALEREYCPDASCDRTFGC